MGLFTMQQVVRTRSRQRLIQRACTLFLQCACWFYSACNPSMHLYTSLCACPQPFRPHTTHARFYDLHCGQKAHRGIRNKMHISQIAQGTNRAARGPSACGQRVEPLFAAGHAEMLQNIGVKLSPGKKERMRAWAHPQPLLAVSFFFEDCLRRILTLT